MTKKIGEILLERGLLSPEDIPRGLEAQKFYGGRVGSAWVDLGSVSERDLVEALCTQKGAEAAKAGALKNIPKATLDLIPVKVAVRYQVVPLARENRRLSVAITDPNDLLALDELAFITGCVIAPLLASERTILNALERYYGVARPKRDTVTVGRGAKSAGKAPAAPPALPGPLRNLDSGETKKVAAPSAASATQALEMPAGAEEKVEEALEARRGADAASHALGSEPAETGPVSGVLRLDDTSPDELPDGNALIVDEASSTIIMDTDDRTIEEAARRLARVEVRDDIADVILWCTEDMFTRSALFIFQKTRTLGWTGQGEGLLPADVRKVVMPVEVPSIFTLVRDSRTYYQGILPDNAGNHELIDALGKPWPPSVLVIPFGIKGRPIGCFYMEDEPEELTTLDLGLMFRLLQKAGLALEMLLIRSKLVML